MSDNDGVLDGQQGVGTLAISTSTSRATGSAIVVGSASLTEHYGFLRFLSLLVSHIVFLLLDKSSLTVSIV